MILRLHRTGISKEQRVFLFGPEVDLVVQDFLTALGDQHHTMRDASFGEQSHPSSLVIEDIKEFCFILDPRPLNYSSVVP